MRASLVLDHSFFFWTIPSSSQMFLRALLVLFSASHILLLSFRLQSFELLLLNFVLLLLNFVLLLLNFVLLSFLHFLASLQLVLLVLLSSLDILVVVSLEVEVRYLLLMRCSSLL